MPEALDKLDHDLIALLRKDARTPAAMLAKQLKASRSTVQNRIVRLQRAGVLLDGSGLAPSGRAAGAFVLVT